MRLILDTTINNPNLPLIDPVMGLINSNAIAVYGMQDKGDLTGRSGPLVTSAGFDSQGIVLDGTANTIIKTPVKQTDEMTVIYAWQLQRAASDAASVPISNLTPGNSPYSGFRLITQANGGEFIQVGTGVTSPAVNQLQTPFSNGTTWVAQAVSWNSARVDKYFPNSLNPLGAGWPVPPKNNGDIFYLNGIPAEVASPTKNGYTGKIGLVAFYNRKMTAEEISALLTTTLRVMADRGVVI